MKKLLIILMATVCLVGCAKEAPNKNPTPPVQATATAAPSATPAATPASTTSGEFPATPEELREGVQTAIEAKDFEALSAFVDWADSPPTFRNHQETMMRTVIDSADDVASVEIGPPMEGQDSIPPIVMDGQTFELTAPISGNLNITYKEATRTNMLQFGESEGRVMILGLKKVGEAAVEAPIRLSMSSTGTVLMVTLNGKTPPGIPLNGATDQDVSGLVQPGVNVLQVTWSHPADSEMMIAPQVSVRRLDPKTKEEVWSKPVPIEGDSGSAKIEFEI